MTDILIVGAGLAGLYTALKLAPRRCVVISPAQLGTASSSAWAQGGLAAALHPNDSAEEHARDTIAAGAGLVEPVVACLLAKDGAGCVKDLLEYGVPFDRMEDGALALSLEAAHSHPRVARVSGDLAGRAIMDTLIEAALAAEHIDIVMNRKAIALLQDENGRIGGVALDNGERIGARETVLCMGGIGGLYRVTTNPVASRGDALAMVYECGGLIADPEFVQFHPTAIDIGEDPAPLATEALRGEGAVLRNADGRAFMRAYHSQGELAPRDEVARAIHAERKAGRGAYLDATRAVGAHFPDHFPTVYAACKAAGVDPRVQPIPIATAAHYHMGGVVSDIWGRSSLDGLSVCGECASTGAHGANRLASNSLLEAVVFGARIARRLRDSALTDPGLATGEAPRDLPQNKLTELRALMSMNAGVIRDADGLTALIDWIETASAEHGASRALTVSRMIAAAALSREESRGGHHRRDFPEPAPPERSYVLREPDGSPRVFRLPLSLGPSPAADALPGLCASA